MSTKVTRHNVHMDTETRTGSEMQICGGQTQTDTEMLTYDSGSFKMWGGGWPAASSLGLCWT